MTVASSDGTKEGRVDGSAALWEPGKKEGRFVALNLAIHSTTVALG